MLSDSKIKSPFCTIKYKKGILIPYTNYYTINRGINSNTKQAGILAWVHSPSAPSQVVITQWHTADDSPLQWRDRFGFSPNSLLYFFI